MNIEQKALEILRAIAHKVANDVGTPYECFASFIDGLYSLLIEGRGLSLYELQAVSQKGAATDWQGD